MTSEEEAICKKYSARDQYGFVHCQECPLVVDYKACVCKRVLEEMCEEGDHE